MRLPETVGTALDAIRDVGRDGLIVRSLILLSTAGCWAVASGLGGGFSWLPTLVVAVAAFAAVTGPDSGAPFALIVVLIAGWMFELRQVSIGWSIVLALAVLAIHVASARAAALGKGAALDRRVARRWVLQTGAVALATSGLWAVIVLLDDAEVSGGVVVSALAVAALAGFALVVAWVAASCRSS
jgi:hypothetical protein